MRRLRRIAATLLVAALGWTVTGAQMPPPAAQDGFQTVAPGELGEQLPAAPLVFGAYAFVWLVLVVYVLTLWRRIARVEGDLAEVSAKQAQAKRR